MTLKIQSVDFSVNKFHGFLSDGYDFLCQLKPKYPKISGTTNYIYAMMIFTILCQ